MSFEYDCCIRIWFQKPSIHSSFPPNLRVNLRPLFLPEKNHTDLFCQQRHESFCIHDCSINILAEICLFDYLWLHKHQLKLLFMKLNSSIRTVSVYLNLPGDAGQKRIIIKSSSQQNYCKSLSPKLFTFGTKYCFYSWICCLWCVSTNLLVHQRQIRAVR